MYSNDDQGRSTKIIKFMNARFVQGCGHIIQNQSENAVFL